LVNKCSFVGDKNVSILEMGKSKGLVRFHILESFSFNEKKKLKAVVADLMEQEGKPFESLDYIFCSDEYLLEINQAYLKHDDLTDIITFDLSDQPGEIKGEIYISVERVLDNSLIFNTSFRNELARVVFHGALHLCGYMDKSKKQRSEIREKEDHYLANF
jgi:probable rRNA maturation factor